MLLLVPCKIGRKVSARVYTCYAVLLASLRVLVAMGFVLDLTVCALHVLSRDRVFAVILQATRVVVAQANEEVLALPSRATLTMPRC